MKLFLFIFAILFAVQADAAPVIAIIATFAANAGIISATTAFIISTAASLLQTAQQRRKQKRQAAAQRAAYNASLTDRTVNVLSTEPPWQIVYGSPAPFSGAIVAMFSSGPRDEYKHIVYVFAAHECQAIDEIYIDGDAVGPLDNGGFCMTGVFTEFSPERTITEDLTFDANGVAIFIHVAVTQVLIAYKLKAGAVINPDGYDPNQYDFWTLTWSYDPSTDITTVRGGPPSTSGVTVSYMAQTRYSRVNVQKHLSPGGVDTADAYLIYRCPDKWTSAHKLSGYTYIVLTLDLNYARFQGGPPQVTAKIRGKKIYDWRTSLTAYSANPILARADFIMADYGFGATQAQIDSASVIAAANACDSAVYSASDQTAGTTVRYSCDGLFSTDQDREATLQQLEDSCQGMTHESGGVWRLLAGTWTAPVMTLTDNDAHGPVTVVQASYSSKERFNGARGTYCDWRNLGVSTDFTPYVNSTFLSVDGEARNDNLTLPFTSAHQRAIQLARVGVERSRGGLLLHFPAHMRAWPLQPGDRVIVSNSELEISNKNFRVTDWGFNLTSPVSLELIEDESSFYDLADATTVDPAPNTDLRNPFEKPTAPQNVTTESGTDQLLAIGGTLLPRVLVTWDLSTSQYVVDGGRTEVRWALAGDPNPNWVTVAALASETMAWLTNVPEGQYIIVQVRFVSAYRQASDWTTEVEYVLGKTEPPSNITSFAVDRDGVATWTAVNDADVQAGGGYRLRWQPGSNRSWGDASPLHEGLITESPYSIIIRPSGVTTFLIKAVDSSGNESAAPAASVINLGDPIVANIIATTDYKADGFPGTITNATVSGGDLVADADASPLAWDPNENTAGWTLDSADGWTAATYKPLTYDLPAYIVVAADDGSQLTLQHTISGSSFLIAFRRDGDEPGWTADAEAGWTDDADLAWVVEDFRPWPGAVTAREGRYEFRITSQSRETQTVISALAAILDVPDIIENVGLVSISSGGTVIPITASFRAVTGIGLTLVEDGGTARTARVESLATRTVTTRDSSNTAVDGTVLATVQGY